jgi:short-subunit dehydrogenase
VRPVRRRTRTFRPNYLSFAGTYQCNLTCPHCCVPIEWTDRLDVGAALRFLEDAHAERVRTLGFTGGEPFLYAEFVHALCRRGAELGFRFDKIMTNGVWHADAGHLGAVLTDLRDAGYTGKLGLSVDKFHGTRHTARLAEFCRTARRAFGRDTIVSISYASRAPKLGLEPVRALADELGGAALIAADLTDPQTPSRIRERLEREHGALHLLVNNAGAFEPTELTDEAIVDVARREMEVNYFGALRMVQAFADTLAARGGAIVNIGSAAGLASVPFVPTYSASKAALHSLTQAARALLAARGVSVYGVYPGPIDTDMAKGIPFDKTAPDQMAPAVLDAVESGDEDIFPDPYAAAFGEQFHASPKDAERQMSAMAA